MATMDPASWIVGITPEQGLQARTRREPRLLPKVGRLLASAAFAYARTDPQIVAMLAADEGGHLHDGR